MPRLSDRLRQVITMPTLTLAATSTSPDTLNAIDAFAETLPAGQAREALDAVISTLRSGTDVIIAGADDDVTPSQAAKVLGVSRAHLYKVLDSGVLPFTVVGARDRRIAMADLRDYVARSEELRRSSARSTAQSRNIRAASIDEM